MASKVDIIRLNLLALDRYLDGLPVNARGTAISDDIRVAGFAESGLQGRRDEHYQNSRLSKTSEREQRQTNPFRNSKFSLPDKSDCSI